MAEDRLKLQPNGDVVLRLKTKYSDGTSHLLFSGLEFVEKLAPLVPQPRIHLTRFFGCLAPHAKIRSRIVPKKEEPESPTDPGLSNPAALETSRPKKRKMSWAQLLARTFGIDTRHCACGGELKIVAAILDASVIRKILIHLGIPHKPPDIAPARFFQQISFP